MDCSVSPRRNYAVVRKGCNDTSRTLDAGHVIDDLIDSHPSLIDSYPNEAYRCSGARCLLA
jgi:hypothetical protein